MSSHHGYWILPNGELHVQAADMSFTRYSPDATVIAEYGVVPSILSEDSDE